MVLKTNAFTKLIKKKWFISIACKCKPKISHYVYTDVWLDINSCDIHRQKMWPFPLKVVPTNTEKINMSTTGRNSSDRRSQTTSWTLRATLAVLLQGFWQYNSIFMNVIIQNASYTRADVTGDFDNSATLWLDWHFLSSNKLPLSGAMEAPGLDLRVLTLMAYYFLS